MRNNTGQIWKRKKEQRSNYTGAFRDSRRQKSRKLTYLKFLYRCQLHHKPSRRASADEAEWIVRAWRGGNNDRVADIAGVVDIARVAELEAVIMRKRVRWVASVFERNMSMPTPTSDNILAEVLPEGTILRWEGV